MLLRLGFIVFFVQFCTTVHGLCERTECQCMPYRHNSRLAECVFRSREMMAMKASDFPSDLGAVVMSGGRELRFDVEVFSHLAHLESVTVQGTLKVFVKEHSFANMSSRVPVSFEFSDAHFLTIEGMSWKNPSGPISVLVARVNTTIIHGQAFSRLTNFTAQDVGKLEILEKAFLIARPYNESITTINLERVHVENLAKTTFLSSVHEVRISGSEVKKVQPDAFSALQIERVIIENTTLHRIEAGAFSDHTLIQTLTLRQTRLHDIESAAFLSGLSNLVISHSKLGVVRSGAVNITVATVLMADNMFSHVHTRGVVLKEWNTLVISNNTFKRIDREAFTSPTIPASGPKPGGPGEDYLIVTEEPVKAHEFNFTRNIIIDVPYHYEAAFDFSVGDDSKVLVDSNFFLFSCHCNMTRVQTLMSGGKSAMFDTGMCSVDENLARCFKLPQGFVNMLNFTETICKLHDSLLCEQVQRDAEDSQNEPSITSAIDISFEDVEREKQILTSLFAIILVGMLLVVVVSATLWVGRKGYCAKARRFLLPSTNSLVDRLSRMFSSGGVTPAVSVSRLSVHEYAELQRKMEEAKMNDEDELPLEDKATQTLPEELTQELLQSLKEKLNDPENYSEARDMIEHLYDLIKVEENCNKNYVDSTFIHVDEGPDNVYDIIKPKKTTIRAGRPELVSQGTRAPSPDKLLPYSKRPTIVSEYMEPRDRKVHTYSEIPPRPDLVPGPITTSISMANRPLPAEPTQL